MSLPSKLLRWSPECGGRVNRASGRPAAIALVLLLAGRGPAVAQAPPVVPPGEVHLTYLANMGVLLESSDARVVIDGLHRGALAAYAPLLPGVQLALEEARAPYAKLTAIVVTHRHLDHFQAAAVAARMAADTSVVFFAAGETVDSLLARAPALRGDGRVRVMRGGEAQVLDGVVIRAIELPHNPTRTPRAENLGFVVELGGQRILHVGDADPDAAVYRARLVADLRVDAAVVPFWYLTEQAQVLQAIGARRYIGSHIPLADTSAVARSITAAIPSASALTTRGMRVTLP